MDMIVLAGFALYNAEAFLFSNLVDQFIEPCANFGRQNFPSVFDTPDKMIVDVIYARPCVDIGITHTYSITYNAEYINNITYYIQYT